jgi:ubiquitin-like protein Nedd8
MVVFFTTLSRSLHSLSILPFTRSFFSYTQIFIKTLTGRKQALNFEPDQHVLAIKQALQEKEGIQVDQIKLIYSGKQLADDKSLESYSINAGATIHMVLQLRGGI